MLAGSLLEAAYMFRWFGRGAEPAPILPRTRPFQVGRRVLPAAAAAALLAVTGYAFARLSGAGQAWSLIPLAAGLLLLALDRLPRRMQGALALVVVACAGLPQAAAAGGIAALFAALLLPGGLVIALASLYRADARPGHYPLLAVLLLSILTLLRAATSLDFFFSWELVTLASYFLIARSPRARPFALQFLLFSLGSAAFILAGFSAIAAAGGGTDLAAFAELRGASDDRVCAPGRRLPDQGGGDRSACLAARRICRGRRRPVGDAVRRGQQGCGHGAADRHVPRAALGGRARRRPSDCLDRHADDHRRSTDGRAARPTSSGCWPFPA